MWLLVCLSALWEIFRPVWPSVQARSPHLRAAVAERTAAPAIPLEPAAINIRPQSPLCISLLRFPIIVLTRSSVIILVVMMIFLPFPSDFRRILLMPFWTAVLLRCRLICRRSRPALPGFPACQAAPPAMPPDGSLVLQGKYQRTAFHAKSQKRVSFSDF